LGDTHLRVEVRSLARSQRGSTEGGLDRIAVGDAQHPDHDTPGALLAALDLELAALEGELRNGNGYIQILKLDKGCLGPGFSPDPHCSCATSAERPARLASSPGCVCSHSHI